MADVASPSWRASTVLSLAFLVLLAIIDRAAAVLAARQPGRLSCWRLSLLGVRSRTADHCVTSADAGLSSDCRGGEPSGDRHGDRDEGVITEEKPDNLGPRDREMLRSILELDVTTAREITVPNLDIIAVELHCSLPEVVERVVRLGYRRMPVYKESIDHVVSISHTRDLAAPG